MPVTEIPRRARLDLFTPAERAIRDAIIAVESTGCDERLTWAVMALSDAQAWVADFVDGVPVAEHYPRPIAPRPPVSPEVLASLQARVVGRMLGASPEVCLDVGRAYLASEPVRKPSTFVEELERLDQTATPGPWRTADGTLYAPGQPTIPSDYVATNLWRAEDGDLIAATRNRLPELLSSARDLASLRAKVEELAEEWEAQREEFADADEDDCCAAVIGSFVRDLRSLLRPGGDDARTPDIQANMQVDMPIVCPRCSVKNWDQTAAAAHARWCEPAPKMGAACEACGGGAGESLYSNDQDDLLRCYACNQALDGG